MPRFIDQVRDRLRRCYGTDSDIVRKLATCHHYDITNVASYAAEFGGKESSEIEFAVPPWDFVYAESTLLAPKFPMAVIAETVRGSDDFKVWQTRIHQFVGDHYLWRGAVSLSVTGGIREPAHWEIWELLRGRKEGWIDAAEADRPALEIHRELESLVEKAMNHPKRWRFTDAQKADLRDIQENILSKPYEGFSDESRKSLSRDMPDEFVMIFFLATMLANCKNVESEVTEVPPKLVRAQVKKDRVPVYRWYSLKIDPMRKTIRRETPEGNELTYERAFHICRGHFKTFTDARPLFGRVTGRFWWPMHARGNREMGTVEKDYEIKAPTT